MRCSAAAAPQAPLALARRHPDERPLASRLAARSAGHAGCGRPFPQTAQMLQGMHVITLLVLCVVLLLAVVGVAVVVGLGYVVHRRPALAAPVGVALTAAVGIL